jgi:hypothetical protein
MDKGDKIDQKKKDVTMSALQLIRQTMNETTPGKNKYN